MGKRRISIQAGKSKGRRLQQWTCARIAEITGDSWGSSGEDHPIESRPMGQSGTDIRMESHVLKKFPYSIECKSHEKWNMQGFIDQARSNVLPDTDWLLICKKNSEDPVVIMDKNTLLKKVYTRMFKNDLHIRHYYSPGWALDAWTKDIISKSNQFNKDTWVILFGRTSSEVYGLMDAKAFFDLFPKAPLKRNK